MDNLEQTLQHFGVKGMKWGVIRNREGGGGKRQNGDSKIDKAKTRVKEEWDSAKRERSWSKKVGDISKMSTKDIERTTTRIRLENDLKRLSANKSISSPKDRTDYRNRGKMKDEELVRKVTRLRARDNLHRQIKDASKEQREFGKKVITTASALAVKSALGIPISPSDISRTWKKPNEARKEMTNDLIKEFEKRNSKSTTAS